MSKVKTIEGTRTPGNTSQVLPFFGKPSGNLYFGVELELEQEGYDSPFSYDYTCECDACYDGEGTCDNQPTGCSSTIVKDLLGDDWVSIKGDGSLNNGLEIATAPSSIDVHRKRWKPLFENWPEKLCAYENCGIHIHASKNFITPQQEDKLYYLMFEPSHYEYITTLSGRGENNWNIYNPGYRSVADNNNSIKLLPLIGIDETLNVPVKGNKYSALHRTTYTYEFRIFPATERYETLMSNIEFVRVMMRYAKLPQAKCNLDDFIKFMKATDRDQPFLVSRREKLGLSFQKSFNFATA